MKKNIKKHLILLLSTIPLLCLNAQISTNRNTISLEHNLLFKANSRYSVQITPSNDLNQEFLFDGKLAPSYSTSTPSESEPTVILIERLPKTHTQAQAYIGWTTRYWHPVRFKIEGYAVWDSDGEWKVLADYTDVDYDKYDFIEEIPREKGNEFTKLRFTFYKGHIIGKGRFGISELFFIHPEACTPYEGLFKSASVWNKEGNNTYFKQGNVGIGTTAPQYKLDVSGIVRAKEVLVSVDNLPDYVFHESYELRPLSDVKQFISENGHLPEIPSACEARESGIGISEFQAKLLQKIEELTLYMIGQHETISAQQEEIQALKVELKNLHKE